MCWYIQYVSSRCSHNINKRAFCVGICPEFLERGINPSLFPTNGAVPECADPVGDTWMINNLCYDCGKENRSNWLDPLDPRIEYLLEEDAPAFDSYNWYVDEMPLNPDVEFEEINWTPKAGTVSEANADEEPVSPRALLPEIPTPSASFRKSIMTAANRIRITGKSNARPQAQADTEDLADKFPLPPKSTLRNTQVDTARGHIPAQHSAPPPIPPRHTGRVLVISHTAAATAPPATPPAKKRKLEIILLSPTMPNITLAPEPVIALDATNPLLASTLQHGHNARQTRANLRTIRDSPMPAYQRAKIVAETRIRLEEMGKGSNAMFKGGLRFTPARVRRNNQGEIAAVEFEGEQVLKDLQADEV